MSKYKNLPVKIDLEAVASHATHVTLKRSGNSVLFFGEGLNKKTLIPGTAIVQETIPFRDLEFWAATDVVNGLVVCLSEPIYNPVSRQFAGDECLVDDRLAKDKMDAITAYLEGITDPSEKKVRLDNNWDIYIPPSPQVLLTEVEKFATPEYAIAIPDNQEDYLVHSFNIEANSADMVLKTVKLNLSGFPQVGAQFSNFVLYAMDHTEIELAQGVVSYNSTANTAVVSFSSLNYPLTENTTQTFKMRCTVPSYARNNVVTLFVPVADITVGYSGLNIAGTGDARTATFTLPPAATVTISMEAYTGDFVIYENTSTDVFTFTLSSDSLVDFEELYVRVAQVGESVQSVIGSLELLDITGAPVTLSSGVVQTIDGETVVHLPFNLQYDPADGDMTFVIRLNTNSNVDSLLTLSLTADRIIVLEDTIPRVPQGDDSASITLSVPPLTAVSVADGEHYFLENTVQGIASSLVVTTNRSFTMTDLVYSVANQVNVTGITSISLRYVDGNTNPVVGTGVYDGSTISFSGMTTVVTDESTFELELIGSVSSDGGFDIQVLSLAGLDDRGAVTGVVASVETTIIIDVPTTAILSAGTFTPPLQVSPVASAVFQFDITLNEPDVLTALTAVISDTSSFDISDLTITIDGDDYGAGVVSGNGNPTGNFNFTSLNAALGAGVHTVVLSLASNIGETTTITVSPASLDFENATVTGTTVSYDYAQPGPVLALADGGTPAHTGAMPVGITEALYFNLSTTGNLSLTGVIVNVSTSANIDFTSAKLVLPNATEVVGTISGAGSMSGQFIFSGLNETFTNENKAFKVKIDSVTEMDVTLTLATTGLSAVNGGPVAYTGAPVVDAYVA